jgi:hypothetical protein
MKAHARRIVEAALLIAVAVASTSAAAEQPAVPATSVVIDCANFALPSQREVGELLGQHNFSQVYDSRRALMAEAHRACHRKGPRYARLTGEKPARPGREAPQEAPSVAYDFGNR